MQVSIRGNIREFEILNILDFTSERKRMSVIVKDPYDNTIRLYIKGADDTIYPRINS